MALYKCSSCAKTIDPKLIRKRIRCPYCGSKILVKERTASKIIKAV